MKKLILLFVGILAISCSNEPTLQKYFVEKSESSDFIALDLGSSLINTEKMALTDGDKEALNSFEKLNVLAFKKDSVTDEIQYKTEKEKVKQILKNKKYEPLFKAGNNQNGVSVYMIGTEKNIEEVVAFASSDDSGFVVARFLSDNLTPNTALDLVKLISKTDFDMEQLQPLQDAFQKK